MFDDDDFKFQSLFTAGCITYWITFTSVCFQRWCVQQHHYSFAMITSVEGSILHSFDFLTEKHKLPLGPSVVPPQSDVPLCINSCCPRHGALRTAGWRCGAEPGTSATRLLSQLAVGSEECGAPCRGGSRGRSARQERGMWSSLLTSSCWLVMEAKAATLKEK